MKKFSPIAATLCVCAAALASPVLAQSGGDFEKQWAELAAAAKKEGTLVLSTGALPEFQPIFDTFTKKFGVQIQADGGSGSARVTRVLAERKAGRFTVDAALMSVAATTRRLEPSGSLVELPPLLIHPEVVDTSKWHQNRHWYVDAKGTKQIFVFSARANGTWRFWYNTDKLTKAQIATLKTPMDFLKPEWKGVMADRAWNDPGRLGGMLEMYFAADAGPEWIKKYFTEMDVTFTSDSRLEESWLVRGSKPLKWDEGDIGEALRKFHAKLPVEAVEIPRKVGNLEARGSECCIVVMKNAPHPNAAKLFLNWFLTKEAQTLVHMTNPPRRYASLRADNIPPGNTDPVHRWEPGKEYVFRDFDKEYLANQKTARDFILANFRAAHGGAAKPALEVHSGKVVDVESGGRAVTIDYKGNNVTARLSSANTEVWIQGKKAARGAVKTGMDCTFTYPGHNKIAKKVDCK